MCGRFSLNSGPAKIKKSIAMDIKIEEDLDISYNIAPTQSAYVITNNEPQNLSTLEWGLIPYWAKDAKIGPKLINARSESVFEKPSFRESIKRKRGLVIADSFYEWKRVGKNKIPYRILMKENQLMVMAGIWDSWNDQGKIRNTFSILTCAPNKEMSTVHTRMPVIFYAKSQQEEWLSELRKEEIELLMNVPPDGILKKYRVSDKVNSVRNNDAALHIEVPETPTLF